MGIVSAMGQNNSITIPDVSVAKGKTISLPVNMDNTADVVAIQFTLTVPEGITLDTYSAAMSDRSDDHTVTFRNIGEGKYMAMIFSSSNKAVKGRTGKVMSLPLTASMALEEGSEHQLTLSDVVISSRDGSNLVTGFNAGKVTIAKSPDLEVSQVTVAETMLTPGGKANVNWTVKNIGGLATTGGWSEQIMLKNEAGATKLLATMHREEPLNVGGIVNGSAEVNIPNIIGMDGTCHISVKITPNSDAGEPSWLQENNIAETASGVEVKKVLYVSPENANTEETNNRNLRFQLSRSGSTANEETFTLSRNADTRVALPESITIAKGQSSVYFHAQVTANKVLDDNAKVLFTIAGNEYPEASASIEIEDDTYPSLSITTEAQDVTEGGNIKFTVSTQRASQSDIEVMMTCDFASHFNIPSSIIIPAGEKSVDVVVEAKEDDVPAAEEVVTFTVTAAKHNSASLLTVLVDNDIPTLQLEITPTAISEAAGPLAITAHLKRTDNIDKTVTVKFSDDSNGGIYYGRQTITLEKGVEEATVNLGPIDNTTVEGERTYNISAAVWIASCSCNAGNGASGGVVTVPLTVYDNDGPALTLTSDASILKEGSEISVTVVRNTATTSDLTVTISSDHDAEIQYPKTVTIPAGATKASFNVISKQNDISGDGFTATLTASATGFASGNIWFAVSDQTLPDAQITEFSVSKEEVEVEGTITVDITVKNTGSYELPELTKLGIYTSASSKPAATIYLQESLAAGVEKNVSVDITMPSTIGTYDVFAVVNDGNIVKELNHNNNSSKIQKVKTVSPFSISVNSDRTTYKPGEKAVITGTVRGGNVAEKDIEIYVINENYRHTLAVTTDGEGKFSAEYEPFTGQMGHFVAGACYPKEGLRDEMFTFDYYGVKPVSYQAITCEALLGDTYLGKFKLSNPGVLPLSNVKVEVVSKPDNVNITPACPNAVDANNTFDVEYAIDATSVSEGNDWQKIVLKITSDEGISSETTIYYYCRNKEGKLKADVTSINTTMIKGASRDYPFIITNIGKGETGKITLDLPSWMTSVTPRDMASLSQGDSTTVILRLTPKENMQLNVPVTGTIGINCSNGIGMSLPFNIEPVSESTGTLVIDVCDENTYYTAEKPHVEGATVAVYHPTTGAMITSGTTGKDGIFKAELPEGYYAVNVSAPKHNSYRNNLLVNPGVESKTTVNLSIEAITVDWKVEETTVKDEYSIVTTVKFETNVPVPVVELSMPESLDAEHLPVGESIMFYASLTNKGLITAEDVELELPSGFNTLVFEPLTNIEPFSLAPQQSILIPIKLTRISQANAKGVSKASPIDNDPCAGKTGVLYYWDCGKDRKWHKYAVAIQLGSCKGGEAGAFGGGGFFGYGIGGGPGGPGGGGGYYGSSSQNGHVVTDEGCEPCQNRMLKKWVECGLSFVPVYGCAKGSYDCGKEAAEGDTSWRHYTNCALSGVGCSMDLCAGATLSTVVGAPAAAVCEIIGFTTNVISCLISFTEPCDAEGSDAKAKSLRAKSSEPDYLVDLRSKTDIPLNEMKAWNEILVEIFGDSVWVANTTMGELYDILAELTLSDEEILTAEKYLSYKPQQITRAQFDKFIARLNNTSLAAKGQAADFTNVINDEHLKSLYSIIGECEEKSMELGYKSTDEMWVTEAKKCKDKLDENSSSVCASITLQFSQSMVMTRQAFRGTLTVFNGNDNTAMSDVKLSLVVKDEVGNVATSHEFQINPESLNGFKGNLNFDEGWTLNAQETGVATILFIPTKYAAPTVNRLYSFGGTLSYVDPFTGLTVTRELSPVTLTVKPSPNLDLTYFMQRDVIGDDPLTEEIEPCEEAEFSLLINNNGYGDATDVVMYTEQPKIIDNEKGLKIDFELMSSQLNGGEKTLALGGTVATNFGNIPAKSTSYAQWWIKSSLLGHFTEYEVEATHVSSYGNPDLSLLNDVTIHELIRSLDASTSSEKLVGFMTNDIADAEDMPDMIYLSNGEIEPVSMVIDAEMNKISDTDYALKVISSKPGWSYGNITDPTYGMAGLKGVKRQSDGKEISLRNFWQTDRTLRDGRDPLYENKIHFADEMASAGSDTYILTFEPLPEKILEVENFIGVPEAGVIASVPVEKIKVEFNKAIDAATFTTDDITLAVQGVKQDVSRIAITTEDDKAFTLDFSAINASVDNGYFVLTVNTSGITDQEGFAGRMGKQVSWVMFRNGFVSISTETYPASAGTIEITTAGNDAAKATKGENLAYGSSFKLTTVPNEGYEFKNWTVNGEVVSTDTEIEYVALSNMDIKANYALKTYTVNVIEASEGGEIKGAASGIYSFGDVLTITAEADEDYAFDGWTVNNEDAGKTNPLTIVVDGAKEITASFTKDKFMQSLSLAKGWNWISSYVNEPVSVMNMLGGVTRILSQNGETTNDPIYGIIEGFDALQPGSAYKMEVLFSATKTFKGRLHDLKLSPIELKSGWNWISYPFMEEKNINSVITNASEGDFMTSQFGFAEFAEGRWEGTLTNLTPGQGYIYKSVSDKTLDFDFDNGAEVRSLFADEAGDGTYYSNVDVRKYPTTMNIITGVSGGQDYINESECRIYAFAGNECRGESRYVDGCHYLTIYGDDAANITFAVENISNGSTYVASNRVTFSQDILGSRKSPYLIDISEATNISNVSNSSRKMKIYSIEGAVIDSDATIQSLKKLSRGLYIVDGQKFMVK